MAYSVQAKKRIRQAGRRADVNKSRRGAIRTEMRKVEEAIVSGNKELAQSAFRQMQPRLMAGVNKGIMNRNTVSRTLSRLVKRIKVMAVWPACLKGKNAAPWGARFFFAFCNKVCAEMDSEELKLSRRLFLLLPSRSTWKGDRRNVM